jgi:hypothetical protein
VPFIGLKRKTRYCVATTNLTDSPFQAVAKRVMQAIGRSGTDWRRTLSPMCPLSFERNTSLSFRRLGLLLSCSSQIEWGAGYGKHEPDHQRGQQHLRD